MDSKSTPVGVSWLADMSRADFDKRLVRKGHKPAAADQAGLFYLAAPVADRKPSPVRQELDGQLDMFGEATP